MNTLSFAKLYTFLAFVYRSYSYHSICEKTGEARGFPTSPLSTFNRGINKLVLSPMTLHEARAFLYKANLPVLY